MHEKAATTARDIGARLQLQLDEYGLILDHLYGLEGVSAQKSGSAQCGDRVREIGSGNTRTAASARRCFALVL